MDNNIKSLNPQAVWKHFAEICKIPHTSCNEEQIREYAIGIAKANKLSYRIDTNGNLLIMKPAARGKEGLKGVILQAHLDMVGQKEPGKEFNFEEDPIDAVVDGGWVRADGTTLGADNGIGVAAALAVLESTDIAHGPLEVLFTVDEENFHNGVYGLRKDFLKGDILINLDLEDEGQLCIGCAGGVELTATFKYLEDRNPYHEREAVRIEVRGLKGGHSGYHIGEQRGNAIKILFRFLYMAMKHFDINISSIDGGEILNAIPREATVVVCGPKKGVDDFMYGLEQFERIIRDEYETVEDNISIKGYRCPVPDVTWDRKTMERVVNAICGSTDGVRKMSPYIPGLVQTSSNLGCIVSGNGQIVVRSLIRSSVDSEREGLVNVMSAVFSLANARISLSNAYDRWMHNADSEIYSVMDAAYGDLFGKKPEAIVVHAGLECGVIDDIYPKIDMISCGPTIEGAHSPYEKVNIDSVDRFWRLLERTLENIPPKKNGRE